MYILLWVDGERADLLWFGELRRYRARIPVGRYAFRSCAGSGLAISNGFY